MSFAYMPLYTGDYLRDTRHLTPLRHGIYMLALMHCWDSKGPIPLDEQEQAGICNCRSADEIDALRYVIDRYFIKMDDGHYNKRMADEVVRFERISQERSAGGLRSAEVRRDKALRGRKAKNEHKLNISSTSVEDMSVSPSPSPSLTLAPSSVHGGAPPNPPSPTAISGKPVAPSSESWLSYSTAYADKYGVQPVRNQKVNSQLKQLVERLGPQAAPQVAGFYLTNRNGLYVAAKHCVDLLLRDAEKLHTEWQTGNVTHQRDAAEQDRMASTGDMWERVGQRLEAKGIK